MGICADALIVNRDTTRKLWSKMLFQRQLLTNYGSLADVTWIMDQTKYAYIFIKQDPPKESRWLSVGTNHIHNWALRCHVIEFAMWYRETFLVRK